MQWRRDAARTQPLTCVSRGLDAGLEPRNFDRDDRSGLRPDLVNVIQEILTVLDEATGPQELNLPGYRLHPLKGELKGYWSVTVRANWRIIFRFEGVDVFDVELTDYH